VRPGSRSNGTPIRDYLHVDDAVAAYLALGEQMAHPEVLGTAFNFGPGSPISPLDLVRCVLDLCDARDVEPDVRGRGSLPGEIDRQYLDSARAARVLGWQARVALDDGLRRTVNWYRAFLAPDGQLAVAGKGAGSQ
jgi:CDP-glucose 4,6-dehydratase